MNATTTDDTPSDAELLAELTEDDTFTTRTEHGETQEWTVTKTQQNKSPVSGSIDYRILATPVDGNDGDWAEFRADPNVSDHIQNVGSTATEHSIVRNETGENA
jgi:hypothetical protein